MADLLPSIPDTSTPEEVEPRVVGLDDDAADDVFAALSSQTARALFAAINDDPAHPSALADTVDTSLQNVQYHLEKLEDADLVEVVDTAYSSKGREMDVYAPTDQPLVVFAGDEEDQSLLSQALSRLLGGLGLVSAAAFVAQGLFGGRESTFEGETFTGAGDAGGDAAEEGSLDSADGGGGATADDAAEPTHAEPQDLATESEPAVDTVSTVADDFAWVGDALAATGLPPGLTVFLLGCLLLAVAVGAWYYRSAGASDDGPAA